MASCEDVNGLIVQKYLTSRIPPRPVKALIIMLSTFSVLGLVGNSLVLYVYARKRIKLSSTVFIIALAGIDFVTSAVGMPYTMIVEGLNYQISTDFLCKLYYFVITCTVPFSVFIMVAISIDRYICICKPHSRVLDSKRARNSVFGLLGMAVAIGVVTALFYGVYLDVSTLRNSHMITDPIKIAVTENVHNATKAFSSFKLVSCSNCVNLSINTVKFSERLTDVIVDLYKQVCTEQHPFNQSYIYTGHCFTNQILFSDDFRRTYQTVYSSSFLVCFSVIFVLYITIYRSVLVRRSRRLAARSHKKITMAQEVSLRENPKMVNNSPPSMISDSPDKNILMTNLHNGARDMGPRGLSSNQQHLQKQNKKRIQHNEERCGQVQQGAQEGDSRNNACLRDKYFLANIRTAVMLFVVTLTFVIAYLPSWLMAFKVIRFNVIVFYVYFSNHIVNPIIYAFMNPAFRHSLKGLICRKKCRAI